MMKNNDNKLIDANNENKHKAISTIIESLKLYVTISVGLVSAIIAFYGKNLLEVKDYGAFMIIAVGFFLACAILGVYTINCFVNQLYEGDLDIYKKCVRIPNILALLCFGGGIIFGGVYFWNACAIKVELGEEFKLMLEWIGENWTGISAAATAISAFATALLAWLTRKMILEMKKTREEASRPYVVVELVHKIKLHSVYLRISNLGNTTAYNITVKSTPELKGEIFEGRSLSNGDVIKFRFGDKIHTMIPKWKSETFVDDLRNFTGDEQYKFQVQYEDSQHNTYSEEYVESIAHMKRTITEELGNSKKDLLRKLVGEIEKANEKFLKD